MNKFHVEINGYVCNLIECDFLPIEIELQRRASATLKLEYSPWMRKEM